MPESCHVVKRGDTQITDIIACAEATLIELLKAALQSAVERVEADFKSIGSAERPPAYEFFAAVLHQHMYCVICGADPDTMAGGNLDIALHVLENGRNIANHYWSGTIT